MQVAIFNRIARNEASARRYLLEKCSRIHDVECPSCGSHRSYIIEHGKRRRCGKCGNSFNPFAGRWLSDVKISPDRWLWFVKLFELETSATAISKETGISYPTVLKALDVTRRAIAGRQGFRSGDPRRVPLLIVADVMGVSARVGGAIQTFTGLPLDLISLLARLKAGWLIWIDRNVNCDTVICCGEKLELVDRGDRFPHQRVFSSGPEGFWPFAKERLAKPHRVLDKNLLLYLSELEFRFLHRDVQLFDVLIERLCSPKIPPPLSANMSETLSHFH